MMWTRLAVDAQKTLAEHKDFATYSARSEEWLSRYRTQTYDAMKKKTKSACVKQCSENEAFLDAAMARMGSCEDTPYILIGDFNICPKRKPANEVSSFLSRQKFNQLVTLPTHIDGGAFLSIPKKQLKR